MNYPDKSNKWFKKCIDDIWLVFYDLSGIRHLCKYIRIPWTWNYQTIKDLIIQDEDEFKLKFAIEYGNPDIYKPKSGFSQSYISSWLDLKDMKIVKTEI